MDSNHVSAIILLTFCVALVVLIRYLAAAEARTRRAEQQKRPISAARWEKIKPLVIDPDPGKLLGTRSPITHNPEGKHQP